MALLYLSVTLSVKNTGSEKKAVGFKVADGEKSLPCEIYAEVKDFTADRKTLFPLFSGCIASPPPHRDGPGYGLTFAEVELILEKLLEILSQLDNEGWEVKSAAERALAEITVARLFWQPGIKSLQDSQVPIYRFALFRKAANLPKKDGEPGREAEGATDKPS